jgi:hypothetical protein
LAATFPPEIVPLLSSWVSSDPEKKLAELEKELAKLGIL